MTITFAMGNEATVRGGAVGAVLGGTIGSIDSGPFGENRDARIYYQGLQNSYSRFTRGFRERIIAESTDATTLYELSATVWRFSRASDGALLSVTLADVDDGVNPVVTAVDQFQTCFDSFRSDIQLTSGDKYFEAVLSAALDLTPGAPVAVAITGVDATTGLPTVAPTAAATDRAGGLVSFTARGERGSLLALGDRVLVQTSGIVLNPTSVANAAGVGLNGTAGGALVAAVADVVGVVLVQGTALTAAGAETINLGDIARINVV